MSEGPRVLGYPLRWLSSDLVAGVTLAAYGIPVSLAYATLAGMPPQVGIYGYLMGGLGYALAGSSRYLAMGPTSAISLMIGSTASTMVAAGGSDYAGIATAAAIGVGLFCLIAWLFRLSVLVKLISDSVLTGFKAGAGLTIAITQLPALFGVSGGGHNVPDRLVTLAGQLGATSTVTLAIGVAALALLWSGERWLPGRPVALGVVALSIIVVSLFGLTQFGVAVTGLIPPGLPAPTIPTVRLRDQDGIVALAMGCMLLAYIEGVAAARTFAVKHHETIDPRRELLGLAAASIATAAVGGYPVAGGLSQTAVNEGAGARSRMSLVFASATLALCLLFFTALLTNLPKAVLAAVVLVAVAGLVDIRAFLRMRRSSRVDFLNALVALIGVLLLGILPGILLAALISVLVLLALSSRPHVAFLGRIPGTTHYSDRQPHSGNEPLTGVLAFRPEGSLLYLNAEHVITQVLAQLRAEGESGIRTVICDLSASPTMDLAGARMMNELHDELRRRDIGLIVCNAHAQVRDLLRAEGLGSKISGIVRGTTIADALKGLGAAGSELPPATDGATASDEPERTTIAESDLPG
ncbi:MAG: SulP family inorganic anion transporter [Proteobacteria bacterium]|nr:SulP family inorganic anion transporter [Pseudomonadota bacterium]